jgi:type I restriction enzyme R subunit
LVVFQVYPKVLWYVYLHFAVNLYKEILRLKPDWHSDKLDKGVLKVVMTTASSDGVKMVKHHTTKEQRRALAERMKNPDDELKLVIVRDMWLTGFDAPCLHTLYINKPMQGHNLMQAIARVNRVYTAAEVIEELIKLSKEIQQMDKEPS